MMRRTQGDPLSSVTVDTTSQFRSLVKTFWDDRVGFCKHILGFTPSDQQGQVLEALDSNDHVAVKSGIAIGKTALEASLILHYSSCRYPFKSPCTSPSKDNLRNILWPELGQWHKKMHPVFKDRLVWTKEKLFLKEDENSFFVARTASKDNPESLQGFHCLSDEHQILTKRGWLGIDDICETDQVLSVPVNGTDAEWMPVTAVYRYPFSGTLNVFDGKTVSFAMTDNHRCVVKNQWRDQKWQFREFNSLWTSFFVRRTSGWKGEQVLAPEPFAAYGWTAEQFAEFVGFWIGDGGIRPHSSGKYYEVQLYQIKDDDGYVERLLKSIPWTKGRDYYAFSDLAVCQWLIDNVGRLQPDRIIPRLILDGPPSVLEAFCDGLWHADGSFVDGTKRQLHNTSSTLMDQVQEVLIKLGRPGTIGVNVACGTQKEADGVRFEAKHDCLSIGWTKRPSDTLIHSSSVKSMPYQGRVWCIATPYQTFYTRRNGRVFISGNSDYVFRIVDEASGVSEDIFDVLEGATGTKETKSLTCGNPTRLEGSFFDAFNKQKEFYKGFTFSSLQSPFAKDRVIERIRKKFGEDSNMWRVRVLGEFPLRDGDSFIPFDLVSDALIREIPDQKDAPKVFGCDIARFGCFDDKTEILTDEGWKYFNGLHGREMVLSLAGERALWAEIAKVHRYEYAGDLNLYEGESVNFCITDNHNLIVRSNPKADQYAIRQFKDLPKEFVIKRTNEWEGSNPERITFTSEYEMPKGGVRVKEWSFDFTDWARFLGWFVSEGNVYKERRKDGRYRILIAQVKAQEKEMIKHLLDNMGIIFQDKGRQIEFSNNEIGKHLIEHCGGRQPVRRVPKYIKEGTTEVIEAFLETFALGDGTQNSNGTGKTYFSSSELLIDDIQEMLVKIGKAGKKILRHKKGTEFNIEGRTVKRRNDCYAVYECGRGADSWISKGKIQKVAYKGVVYCVSTPHRTIMVRRNGCVMWSGNSDDTVIAIRQGDEFKPFHVLRNKSTMEVAGFIAHLANKEKPQAIFVDVIGIGSGVYDRLEELGFPVIPVNVSESPALDARQYRRLRDELWGLMRDWLETRRGRIWDNEEGDLVGQLTTPKYRILESSGLIVIESKDDMKKRGVASPNVADACILTFAQPVSSYQREMEDLYGREEEEAYAPMDAEAGY
jgi:hypothetical protein